MSFLSKIFKPLGVFLAKAFNAARASGLTDELVQIALPFVRQANAKFVDNAKRREWVVAVLIQRGVPERIARIVVELAYGIYRKELGKAGV